MNYIIVPTSNSDYQSWQCRLLNWSRKKVKQKGKLIFLRCEDEMGVNKTPDIYNDPDVEVIDLPNYALEWEYNEEQSLRGQPYWWGAIPNKYLSIKWLCDNYPLKDDDTLLFLDPDMIFLEPIDMVPVKNEIIAQRFIHYYPIENWKAIPDDEVGRGIMYPFIIRADSLKLIINDYISASEEIKRETKKWEAEMWGLDFAVKKNILNIRYEDNLGRCTAWHSLGEKGLPKIIHFPNEILDKNNNRLWFKQDYTFRQNMDIFANLAKNEIDNELLSQVSQERTDYLYYLKWNFSDIFKNYTGNNGYIIFRPWPGGFNNIRMSLELAVCIAYLSNKTLVLPPKYKMYLLKDEFGLEDFFDVEDLGVNTISFENFCELKGIGISYDAAKSISKVLSEEFPRNVYNLEKILPSFDFTKGRGFINKENFLGDNECVFFDGNLLGSFYQTLHTNKNTELKKLVAKHIHYLPKIFDIGWKAVNWMGEGYYAMHVRRNDFQYKDLFISAQEIYENIKDIVPNGATLYIATDLKDLSFFDPLKEHYLLYFYNQVAEASGIDPHYNYIPIVEQLICTRAIKFIGNDYSTLSSYIYRMRGYMNDIEDKDFYINTQKYNQDDQLSFRESKKFIANWAREFKDVWNFTDKTIFVSVASYNDRQLISTLKDLYETADNIGRIVVGVHLQDNEEYYQELLNQHFPNIKIIFTKAEESRGVVWAREKIKSELFNQEDYFLQIDAHSRFKFGWDNILINQIINLNNKSLISTYPNEFSLDDTDRVYISKLSTNAPLRIKKFFSEDLYDNRLNPENKSSLGEYEVADSKWIAGGFIFAPREWVEQVKFSDEIVCKGEEDIQFFLSYLKGWNVKLPSEAVVWHNYNALGLDGLVYRKPNLNSLKDNSVQIINDILFNQQHSRTIEQLEEFLEIKFRKINNNDPIIEEKEDTIFVALTSFIDTDLRNTILSCIHQAKHPEKLSFGLILQYNNETGSHERCVDELIEQYNIRVKKYWYEESKGGCWARYEVADLLKDEKYILQIDSHTRFVKNWDEILINDIKNINEKCIISYLSPPFYRNKELGVDYYFKYVEDPYIINVPKITSITNDYWPTFVGYTNEKHTNNKNRMVSILYAGFVFAPASWYHDVRNDPEHYYTGEEFALSIRTFTHGYNIYQPSRIVSWHKSDPDHIHHFKTLPTGDDLHNHAMSRLKMLIEGGNLERYGLGNERTLSDYENFAGINIKQRIVYE
jgi:hypothetical protein